VAWSGLFVLAIVYIGSKYSIQEGTLWIIVVLVGFIIAMMGTGYLLSKIEE
jgi:heme A synthase